MQADPKPSQSPQQSPKKTPVSSPEDQSKIIENKKKAAAAVSKRASKSGLGDYQYHIVIGGFILLCAVALGSVFLGDHRKLSQIPVIEEALIEKSNALEGKKYKLGGNEFFKDWKLSQAKGIISGQLSNKPSIYKCQTESDASILPTDYDFFVAFPECRHPVFSQGNCSAAYSIAAVSSLSDRFCRHTKEAVQQMTPVISPQTVISCDSARNYQCSGGAVTPVFDYAKKEGLLDMECLDFGKVEDPASVPCPTDLSSCQRYYVQDYCLATDVEGIKKEIYKNGPVVAMMIVYRDFLIYSSGIYDPEEGQSKFRSGQAVKIYGWGAEVINEEMVNYWLVENSWGETWGQKGSAKVKVKIADNFLDQFAIAAMPKVEKEVKSETPSVTKEEGEKAEVIDMEDLESGQEQEVN